MYLLLKQIKSDYPEIRFLPHEEFQWSPSEATVYYMPSGDTPLLLHELAHALLGHTIYRKDIELISLERDAWHYAKNVLALRYDITILDRTIEDMLDTYRDWIHARSKCPQCKLTGMQTKKDRYKCISCLTIWKVNEAKSCALRRYVMTN
jgi:hypothetical protein